MQQIEVDKETTFVEGQGIYWVKIKLWGSEKLAIVAYPEDKTNPTTDMILEPPLRYDQEMPASEKSRAERFNTCGILSTTSFANVQDA